MLLLYAKGHRGEKCEPIRGRTRLMKMIFLFDKEVRRKFNLERNIPHDAIPDFAPYHFGPFSAQVFNDLEFLVDMGFVEVRQVEDGESLAEEGLEYDYWQAGAGVEEEREDDLGQEEFSLTRLGREFVEAGEAGKLTDEQWSVIDEFKRRCTSGSLRTLLQYVYSRYPEMASESRIRNEILPNA